MDVLDCRVASYSLSLTVCDHQPLADPISIGAFFGLGPYHLLLMHIVMLLLIELSSVARITVHCGLNSCTP